MVAERENPKMMDEEPIRTDQRPEPIQPDEGSVRMETVGGSSISDQPAGRNEDSLGFEPYVTAVAEFLTHPDTRPPLAMSIEGEWGSGKSSFMRQLEEYLRDAERNRREYVVSFNPWKHAGREELWSAFALQFVEQISKQVSWRRRRMGHLRIKFARVRWVDALPRILVSVATVAAAIGLASISLFYLLFQAPQAIGDLFTRDGLGSLLGQSLAWVGGFSAWIAVLAIVVAAIKRSWDFIGPVWIDPRTYSTDPRYGDRLSFLDRFHVDFRTIVRAFVKSGPVFVLVDDLDRCEPSQIPELMHALNLMITQDPDLFFVIAMDREKIAAAIATAYGDTATRLSNPNEDSEEAALRFGYEYLEKFIQLSFTVPTPSEPALRKWLSSLGRQDGSSSAPPGELQPRLQRLRVELGDDSSVIHDLALMVAPFLGFNVRRMKQFLNQLRIRAYIADLTGLFHRDLDGASDDRYQELTFPRLAKLVTISMRWPSWIDRARTHKSTFEDLEALALGQEPESAELVNTSPPSPLLELIASGLDNGSDYSLRDLDIERWLEVSPRSDPAAFVRDDREQVDAGAVESKTDVEMDRSRSLHISSDELEVPSAAADLKRRGRFEERMSKKERALRRKE